MAAFGMTHFIELGERFVQTGVERLAELILFFVGLGKRWRQPADDARQAKQGNDIQLGRRIHLMAKFFGGVKISLQQLAIYLNGSGGAGLDVQIYVQVAAVNLLAHDLTHAELVDVETLGQAKPDVKEAVVNAFDTNANGPAVGFAASLRVARHGDDCGFFTLDLLGLRRSVLGHKEVPGVERFGTACAGASMSSSANCKP